MSEAIYFAGLLDRRLRRPVCDETRLELWEIWQAVSEVPKNRFPWILYLPILRSMPFPSMFQGSRHGEKVERQYNSLLLFDSLADEAKLITCQTTAKNPMSGGGNAYDLVYSAQIHDVVILDTARTTENVALTPNLRTVPRMLHREWSLGIKEQKSDLRAATLSGYLMWRY